VGCAGRITVVEVAVLAYVFQPLSSGAVRLVHYVVTPRGGLFAWALAIATTVAYVAYSMQGLAFIKARAFKPQLWSEVWGLRLFAVLMAFVTGLFEEFYFRSQLMDLAMHRGAGAALQVVISALAFGVTHGVWALFGGVGAGIGAVAATGVLGFLLALVYLMGGRSLLPCVASHTAINLVIEPWLILAAVSGNWGRGRAVAP
jgi:hypothetical protein